MNLEALSLAGGTAFSSVKAEDRVDSARKQKKETAPEPQVSEKSEVASEELLSQIKGFSGNGAYGVRFENSESVDQLVVKVFDQETDELIRQIPSEELLQIKESLGDLRGNLISAEG